MNKILMTLCLALATALPAFNASAYPDKPVMIVVPFPAGGPTDSIARSLGAKLQEKLNGKFVVENRAGATGTIGATYVRRAPADGYTLFVTSLGPLVIAPHLISGVQYDALKDFDYLTVAVQAPNVLVVPAASPINSVADLLATLKKEPGKVSFASSGNGSSDHLTAELFWQQTQTSGMHIPYKGGAPALNDLLGGHVRAAFFNINAVLPHVKAGKLKALAITSAKRSPVLPDVRTLDESGVSGANVYSWQAVAAPKGLPADLRNRLHSTIVGIINEPAFKDHWLAQGLEIVANTPEQFAQFQAAEFARWKKVIDTGNIKAD